MGFGAKSLGRKQVNFKQVTLQTLLASGFTDYGFKENNPPLQSEANILWSLSNIPVSSIDEVWIYNANVSMAVSNYSSGSLQHEIETNMFISTSAVNNSFLNGSPLTGNGIREFQGNINYTQFLQPTLLKEVSLKSAVVNSSGSNVRDFKVSGRLLIKAS